MGIRNLLPVDGVNGRVNIHAQSTTVPSVEINTSHPRSCSRWRTHRRRSPGNRPPAQPARRNHRRSSADGIFLSGRHPTGKLPLRARAGEQRGGGRTLQEDLGRRTGRSWGGRRGGARMGGAAELGWGGAEDAGAADGAELGRPTGWS
jgi:hypothetical protein